RGLGDRRLERGQPARHGLSAGVGWRGYCHKGLRRQRRTAPVHHRQARKRPRGHRRLLRGGAWRRRNADRLLARPVLPLPPGGFAVPFWGGMRDSELAKATQAALRGGAERYHHKNQERGKFFARERIARLVDDDSFVEDGLLANALDGELPADGVITGVGRIA